MRKFLFLMTMICTLGFFASCSSSDDDNTKGGETSSSVWDIFKAGDYEVWGEYLSTNDNLLSYELQDMKVSVTKAGDNTAKITMLRQRAGDTISVTVPEAAIVAVDGYTLKGTGTMTISTTDDSTGKYSKVSKDATVTVKISSDYKDVSAEVKFDGNTMSYSNATKPTMAKLMKTWYVTPSTWYDESGKEVEAGDASAVYADGCFKFNWTTNEGTSIDFGENKMSTADVATLVERMVNAQDLSNVLSSVAFTRDNKIIARYRTSENKGDDTKWKIAEGYATYKTMTALDNLIYVILDKEKILADVTDATEKATLSTILDAFEGGIPVNIEWSNNDSQAFFYLNKTFAEGIAQDETVVNLVKNLKDSDMDGMGALIKSLCAQVPGLMENTTELKVGLELVK